MPLEFENRCSELGVIKKKFNNLGSTPPISSSSVKYSSTTMSSSDNSAMIKENCNDFSPDVNKQLTAGNKQTNLLRLNHDSTTSDDLDGDDEDRLVIADEDAEAIGGLFIFFVYILHIYTNSISLHYLFTFFSLWS